MVFLLIVLRPRGVWLLAYKFPLTGPGLESGSMALLGVLTSDSVSA